MVRLVDHDEAHAARRGELARVDGEELRRGEDDVDRARAKPRERLGAALGGRLAREHAGREAEGGQLAGDVEALVGHEGAERKHEDAGLTGKQGLARGVHVEDERLAAARRHDAQGVLARRKGVEGSSLRGQKVVVADEAPHELAGERTLVERAQGAAGGGVCGEGGLA